MFLTASTCILTLTLPTETMTMMRYLETKWHMLLKTMEGIYKLVTKSDAKIKTIY